jgi:sulfate permease, SulP family
VVYRISGAFFFGAASTIASVLDGLADRHKAFIIDFAAVPFLDSTAANAISKTAEKARHQGVRVFVTGTSQSVRRALLTHGVRPPRVKYRADIAHAIAEIKAHLAALRAASEAPALH